MLVMLLIGWIVLLPAFVVTGLYIGASVLSRRRGALHTYEDLFTDEESLDPPPGRETLQTTVATARPVPIHGPGRRVDHVPVVDEKPPVAARY